MATIIREAQIEDGGFTPIQIKTSSYTVSGADAGSRILFNSASNVNCILPQTSTEIISEGATWNIENIGSGTVTIVTEGSDTLLGASSVILENGYNSTIIKLIAGTPNTYTHDGGTPTKKFIFSRIAQGTVSNRDYYIIFPAFSGKCTRIKAITRSGTCQVFGKINGIVMSHFTVNASTTFSASQIIGNNEFNEDDKIEIQVLSASGCTDLSVFIEYERKL